MASAAAAQVSGSRSQIGDGCAERCQPLRDAAADAGATAGDDRDAAGEQDVGRVDGHIGEASGRAPCR